MTAVVAGLDVIDRALERARDGDHDAFAEIVAEHESMVYSIAYHFFHDRDRAAEIAQEAFLQLYRSIDGITTAHHLTHWLRQVTSRKCIDAQRRSRVRLIPMSDAGELSSPARTRDPFLARRLNECITRLPAMQRIILTLRYQEGLGPNEISSVIGMRVNTVKSQLHRALRSLRKKLEGR